MEDINYKQEAEDFDNIASERYKNNQKPDIRAEFFNDYFYNNIWRNSLFLQEEYGPIFNWIILNLKKHNVQSVVEFGCGNGFLSLELARNKINVLGLDLSPLSIAVANDYKSKLPESQDLKLEFAVGNITEFVAFENKSITFLGFLHHLPQNVLDDTIKKASQLMSKGQIIIGVEPRYDYVNYPMSLLTAALRSALPNHYKNDNLKDSITGIIDTIYNEMGELDKTQSAHDNECFSSTIIEIFRKYFTSVELEYSTAFYDKIIGSIRVEKNDELRLTKLLKEIDNIIIKYNPDFARNVLIKAVMT